MNKTPNSIAKTTARHASPTVMGRVLLGLSIYMVGLFVGFMTFHYDELRVEASTDLSALVDLGLFTDVSYAAGMISIECALMLLALWFAFSIFQDQGSRLPSQVAATTMIALVVSLVDVNEAAVPLWAKIAFSPATYLYLPLLTWTILTFPDGRFIPKWSRVLPIIVLLFVPLLIFEDITSLYSTPINIGFNLLAFSVIPICIWSTIHRYRHVAYPTQRQQIKWVMFGFVISGVLNLIGFSLDIYFEATDNTMVLVWLDFIENILFLALPYAVIILTITFAVRQQRLYDVDLIANRAYVYGTMFIILALLYAVTTFVIVRALGASNQPLALILALLAPLSLFNWLRKRIQHFVDVQFFGLRIGLNDLGRFKPSVVISPDSQTFGKYTLLSLIGRGGMGDVYHVVDESGHDWALKLLSHKHLHNEQARERFKREANVLEQLNHPAVVPIIESGIEDSIPYFVMELVEGKNLEQLLQENSPLPLQQAMEIASDIAQALAYIHSHSIIHRDIKPSNILVKDDNRIVLLDFGLVKIADEVSHIDDVIVGTMAYISPEQIKDAKVVDFRADQYALGLVCYEMLTGKQPYEGTVAQMLFAHLNQPLPDVRQKRPDASVHASLAILHATSKNPDDRYPTVEQFAMALQG